MAQFGWLPEVYRIELENFEINLLLHIVLHLRCQSAIMFDPD